MSRTLPSTLRDLALAIRSHSNAWASARDTANKAHLAAVMGPSLARALGRDGGWDTRSAIDSDDSLSEAIWSVVEGDTPTYDFLVGKIASHIDWLTDEIGRSVEHDVRVSSDPVFRIDAMHACGYRAAGQTCTGQARAANATEVHSPRTNDVGTSPADKLTRAEVRSWLYRARNENTVES